MAAPVPRLTRIRFVTWRYQDLQGLRQLPVGLFLTGLGVVELIWPRVSLVPDGPVGMAVIALPLAGLLVLDRRLEAFYARTYGRVEPRPVTGRGIWRSVLPGGVMVAAVAVLLDPQLPATVGVAAVAGAVLLLTLLGWRRHGGIRPSEATVAAVLVAAALGMSLFPDGWLAQHGVPLLPIGMAWTVGGLLDHLVLVRSFPAPLPEAGVGEVGDRVGG